MRRGDLVIAAVPGDYGKPRPVLVLQDDAFEALPSVTVMPLTTDLHTLPLLRIEVPPSPENGLHERSQIMIDKVTTISRTRMRQEIGRVDNATMLSATAALAVFLGLIPSDDG